MGFSGRGRAARRIQLAGTFAGTLALSASLIGGIAELPTAKATTGTGSCTSVDPALDIQITCTSFYDEYYEGAIQTDSVAIPVGAHYVQFVVKGSGRGYGQRGSRREGCPSEWLHRPRWP